jgi:dihydroorotate dehydrogenase electron transfer subunit
LLLACNVGDDLDSPEPGQFVHLDVLAGLALRRPFSVAGVPVTGVLELLIELRGEGTRALSALPVGTTVSILGPLGRGFTMPPSNAPAVIVAGGAGVAGVRLLAQRLAQRPEPLTMLVGARSRDHLLHNLLPEATEDGRLRQEIATDDGSAGLAGTVCDLLARELGRVPDEAVVYCCGPRAMTDAAGALALERDLHCEVSLEEVMACGTGACRGCVVETRDGYRTVCSDGPVFDARALVLDGVACA